MAHTVPKKGPPPRPIYPTACMYSVGRLRSLHADCRPVRTTRPNWGRNSGLWRPSNGQPTWPLATPCCALVWGRHGGWVNGLGPQGCTRCPTDAAACFRRGVACVLPPILYSLIITTPKLTFGPPSSSSSCRFEPTVSGLDIHTYFCHLSAPPARRRQPADQVTVRSPWFADSGTCTSRSLGFWSCFFQVFFTQFPPRRSLPFLFTNPLPLSHASERATSINHRASSCCIYVIEPAGHQVPCSHLLGGVLSENCVLHH